MPASRHTWASRRPKTPFGPPRAALGTPRGRPPHASRRHQPLWDKRSAGSHWLKPDARHWLGRRGGAGPCWGKAGLAPQLRFRARWLGARPAGKSLASRRGRGSAAELGRSRRGREWPLGSLAPCPVAWLAPPQSVAALGMVAPAARCRWPRPLPAASPCAGPAPAPSRAGGSSGAVRLARRGAAAPSTHCGWRPRRGTGGRWRRLWSRRGNPEERPWLGSGLLSRAPETH